MAKWFKEHLGFKTTKAPPPAPPKPDYRHCHPAVPGTPGYHQQSSGATSHYPSPAQPDILAAYKLQKELDFEDPYTGGGNISFSTGMSSVGSPDIKYVSPKHRLIKVDTIEKGNPATGTNIISAPAVSAGNVKSPTSPPVEQDNKQEKLVILEDYADPFDAEQAGGTQGSAEKATENDGYMEPYEAQKMMAEIRGGRAPKDGPVRQLPLYDTPYEPEENGGDSDPERPPCPRESRLPQDDERPPEEYDQPWEWKKDRISKAFAAVEIKVIKDLPWPPPVGQLSSTSLLAEGVEVPTQPAQPSPGQPACDQHHHVRRGGEVQSVAHQGGQGAPGPAPLQRLPGEHQAGLPGPQRPRAGRAHRPLRAAREPVLVPWSNQSDRCGVPLEAVQGGQLPGEEQRDQQERLLPLPQEQPGLHAHETDPDQRQQVHPGPEQLPVRQRARDHPLLLQPQAANQGGRAHVPAVPRGHQDAVATHPEPRRPQRPGGAGVHLLSPGSGPMPTPSPSPGSEEARGQRSSSEE
ncbi:trithorax group protein osa-like isoform X1 [Anguilla anguilla]|uniref:trithorax group protein osa-like isoform X1 n=1 Tax=Anguilla anguilla TaxID=7936 RepID=UPI0015AB18F1|nr:trithorax group protein osa-like isoform X1 [Anguilla anguilla]